MKSQPFEGYKKKMEISKDRYMEEEAPPATEEATHEVPEEPTVQEQQPKAEVPSKPPPKPKGHRRKDPNTEVLTDKTSCEDCNQTMSKHTKRYTHRCPAKKTQVKVEAIQPVQDIKDTSRATSDLVAQPVTRQPVAPLIRHQCQNKSNRHNHPDEY